MRVLFFPRYSRLGPSSRVRFYQYAPYFDTHDIRAEIAPLLNDAYIRTLYSGKRAPISTILAAYRTRLAKLTRSRSFDLLWIEKELFPWLPPWAESTLDKLKVPYIVDYDDAVFHRYDMHHNAVIRRLLGKSIADVMKHARTVVVGNEYLAKYAHQNGARRIEYLPSVVDTDRYTAKLHTSNAEFRIGWIGSPVTAPYVALIREALQEVLQQHNAHLILIGAGSDDPLPGLPKEILPWQESSEVAAIQSLDVGIMPLPQAPFEQGKCGYKLIQYMACALPVIASPVGVNAQIIDHGQNGFLASTPDEWAQALLKLHRDPALRNSLGQAGRRKVEEQYSLRVAAPRFLEILKASAKQV